MASELLTGGCAGGLWHFDAGKLGCSSGQGVALQHGRWTTALAARWMGHCTRSDG